ncbi:MAG: hypothetical protein ABJC36_05330 [Gemmatimonadales bacterium]
MSSHPHSALFDTTHSALLLPRPADRGMPSHGADDVNGKSNLDKNFWIMRELGRYLALVDHGVGMLDLARCPEGIPT